MLNLMKQKSFKFKSYYNVQLVNENSSEILLINSNILNYFVNFQLSATEGVLLSCQRRFSIFSLNIIRGTLIGLALSIFLIENIATQCQDIFAELESIFAMIYCLFGINWRELFVKIEYKGFVIFPKSSTAIHIKRSKSSTCGPLCCFNKNNKRSLIFHRLSKGFLAPSVSASFVNVGNQEATFLLWEII